METPYLHRVMRGGNRKETGARHGDISAGQGSWTSRNCRIIALASAVASSAHAARAVTMSGSTTSH